MVAQVVVGVADADVEDQPQEQLPQALGHVRPRAGTDRVRDVGVAAVAGVHLVQAQNRQGREHQAPFTRRSAVEAFQQQHVAAGSHDDVRCWHGDPHMTGKHGGEALSLDHGPRVRRGGELRDERPPTVLEQGLGPGATDGGAVTGRCGQVVRQVPAGLDDLGRTDELVEGGWPAARFVLRRRELEIERADAVAARSGQVRHLGELHVRVAGVAEVEHTSAPRVGGGVTQAAVHRQRRPARGGDARVERPGLQRKLRGEERDGVVTLAVAACVGEQQRRLAVDGLGGAVQHSGDDGVDGSREPHPDEQPVQYPSTCGAHRRCVDSEVIVDRDRRASGARRQEGQPVALVLRDRGQRATLGGVDAEQRHPADDSCLEHGPNRRTGRSALDPGDELRAHADPVSQLDGGPPQFASAGGDLCSEGRQRMLGRGQGDVASLHVNPS